jgi:hypothetical protein
MLAWNDCVEPSRLSDHERQQVSRASELGQLAVLELEHYVAVCPVSGQHFLSPTILEDLRNAQQLGDERRALTLKLALGHFVQTNRKSA